MNPFLIISDAAKESWRRAGHKVELTPDLFLRYIREGHYTIHDVPGAGGMAEPYNANFREDGTAKKYIMRGFERLQVSDEEFDRSLSVWSAWKAAWSAGERDFEAWSDKP